LPGHYYLCGGVGNASGKQDAGWIYYFDLSTLDLQNRRIQNLWRAAHTTVADRIIALANAGGNGHDDLYALFGPTTKEAGALQLCQISSVMPGRRFVGEGLDVVTGWWPMLYFDSSYQRFLLVVPPRDQGDSAGVRIFSLAYPPMIRAELALANRHASGTFFIVLLAGVVVTGLGFGLRYASKRNQPHPRKGPGRGEQRPEPTRSSIRIFGGFKVIDSSGTDISDQFSQRIRHLFLLLLVRTRYGEGYGGDGIGANELAELLWPGIDPQSARDSRNVAIAALRKLLRRIGGVSIDLKNKKYFVHIGDEVDCDYKRFREAVHEMASATGTGSEAGWNELLSICRTGVLVPGLSLSWLDAIRADVFSEFEKLASARLSAVRDGAGEPDLTTAEVLLAWDPINEQALRTKLRVLWKSGRHGAARVAYEQFTANYVSAYGRPCDLTMKDILSDQTRPQQDT
jgi:DNA-binding SARP family transcriptional activator